MVSSSSANSESAPVGTDFTRDFYRLVKFESSKSLASSSSKSQTGGVVDSKAASTGYGCDLLSRGDDNCVDREQALQSVLKFIAEQQRYCISRLVQDEQRSSVAIQVDGELEEQAPVSPVTHEDDDGYFSKISFDNGTGVEETMTTEEEKSYSATEEVSTRCCDNDRTAQAVQEDDVRLLFKTCDTCFQSIDNVERHSDNICDKCAECYIDCLPEESGVQTTDLDADYGAESEPKVSRYVAPATVIQKSCLDTVLEEQEDGNPTEQSELMPMTEEKFVNLHERATSKEVIEELNRMIRKGDELSDHGRTTPLNEYDESFGCSTGWVHVEQDIDFTDPKVLFSLTMFLFCSMYFIFGLEGGKEKKRKISLQYEGQFSP